MAPGAGDWAFTCLLPVWAGDNPNLFVQAADSIAAQTLRPTELYFCEDGTLPGELEAAVEAQARRLGARRLRHPGPAGLHHNLNRALAEVSTPWLCRADADDINLAERFEAQMGLLATEPSIAALGSDIVEVWPDGAERRKTMPIGRPAIERWAVSRNPLNHMTVFARTAAVRDCGGYPAIPLKEDYGLWLRMIARGHRLENLGEALVRARLAPDFHARRSGLRHLPAEWALHRLRRALPGVSPLVAATVLIGRSAALAAPGPARMVYESVLRQ